VGILDEMLIELREDTIMRMFHIPHGSARASYPVCKMTVADEIEFDQVIADYYNHHFSRCVSPGAKLPDADAASRAKAILDQAYYRQGQLLGATQDGLRGTNGGMPQVLNTIMERLREEAVENYMRDVFDRYVLRGSFREKVEIMRELLRKLKAYGVEGIDEDEPEQYAHNYQPLIRAFVESGTTVATAMRNH
jgi:hypothetical protein